MCGGNLNITEGSKTTTCEYCRTQQTVPAADDEKRANLFNRANHFRQNCEFDKAMGIYEHILEEDSSDAEAYWSIVLCRYGIEYVEDPATKIQKPTVNRTQAQSILRDADYLMALEHADYAQKALYEKEAQEIDRIQSDILQIAQNEQPYDIFISYKEKAPDGERTRSSVLAQDVYNHLKKAGYKVFFSRISLEDKVGQKYEPYIYSALNSSKVMLVIGTQKDEFMAPWVRNEWSRFVAMMREDTGKLLIPCFRDLDIDDLPNEFQILQSQDMSKIGFEQDLLRGISKIVKNVEEKHQLVQTETDNKSINRLIQNAETFMRLGNYEEAYRVYEKVSQTYPEDYRGWWGMIIVGTNNFEDMPSRYSMINQYLRYVKQLAPDEVFSELREEYAQYIKKISPFLALKDIEQVKENIDYYNNQISNEYIHIQEIWREATRKREVSKKEIAKIHSRIEQNKSDELQLLSETTKLKRKLFICFLLPIIAVGVIVWTLLSNMDNITSALSGQMCVAIIICIIAVLRGTPIALRVQGEIEWTENEIKRIRGEMLVDEELKKKSEKERSRIKAWEDDSKKPYNQAVNRARSHIQECEKYMRLGQDVIADVLCKDAWNQIGFSETIDPGILALRKEVIHADEVI